MVYTIPKKIQKINKDVTEEGILYINPENIITLEAVVNVVQMDTIGKELGGEFGIIINGTHYLLFRQKLGTESYTANLHEYNKHFEELITLMGGKKNKNGNKQGKTSN